MKIVQRTFLATAIVFLLTCTLHPVAGKAADIRVGTWRTAQTIQPFFYNQFMTSENTITVYPFTNPADQKVALLAGSLDMCGTTLAHAIHSASRGQPIVVVAALCNKCSALVVRKGGNVKTVNDLRGKKIGYVPGTMHEILLRETLTRNGISPERDVRLTRVDFFDMGMALARGSIDAFLSGEPFPSIAVDKGYGNILSYPYYDDTIGDINAGMIVTRDTIKNDPMLVERLVRLHAEVTQYLQTHHHEWLMRVTQFGVSFSVLEKAASNIELTWRIDEPFIQKTRALGQRMEALGVIDRQPDYDQLFDLTFVKRITQ